MTPFETILDNVQLRKAVSRLAAGKTLSIAGVWGSAAAAVTSAIAQHVRQAGRGPQLVLYLTANLDQADEAVDDIEVLTGREATLFPAWETELQAEAEHVSDEVAGERVRICNALVSASKAKTHASTGASARSRSVRKPKPDPKSLATSREPKSLAKVDPKSLAISQPDDSPQIIIAPVMAILQPVPTEDALSAGRLTLRKGQDHEPERLVEWLVDAGFEHVEQVDQQGEFARRGGIVDIFPVGSTWAVRVEFWGDTIDSIRRFDLDTQRSTDDLETYDISGTAAGKVFDPRNAKTLLDYLPAGSVIIMPEPTEVMELAGEIYRRVHTARTGLERKQRDSGGDSGTRDNGTRDNASRDTGTGDSGLGVWDLESDSIDVSDIPQRPGNALPGLSASDPGQSPTETPEEQGRDVHTEDRGQDARETRGRDASPRLILWSRSGTSAAGCRGSG